MWSLAAYSYIKQKTSEHLFVKDISFHYSIPSYQTTFD